MRARLFACLSYPPPSLRVCVFSCGFTKRRHCEKSSLSLSHSSLQGYACKGGRKGKVDEEGRRVKSTTPAHLLQKRRSRPHAGQGRQLQKQSKRKGKQGEKNHHHESSALLKPIGLPAHTRTHTHTHAHTHCEFSRASNNARLGNARVSVSRWPVEASGCWAAR